MILVFTGVPKFNFYSMCVHITPNRFCAYSKYLERNVCCVQSENFGWNYILRFNIEQLGLENMHDVAPGGTWYMHIQRGKSDISGLEYY